MGAERVPIGHIIDGLGVDASFSEGDMPTDAVVLLKVVTADGRVVHRTLWSDGMSWIERRGMIDVARDVERVEQHDTSQAGE